MTPRRKKRIFKRTAAIIVAAGEGRRFGGEVPKQWADLAGRPILSRTIERFEKHTLIDEIILVIDSAHRAKARRLANNESPKISAIVSGGKSRAESVRRGLKKVTPGTDVILIHDGVRPFFEDDLIDGLLELLNTYDGVVPVALVGETLKRLAGPQVDSTVDRKGVALAKTPQAFHADVILRAHTLAEADHFEATDDSVLVERMGSRIGVLHTTHPNIKITLPDDLLLAQALVQVQGGRRS